MVKTLSFLSAEHKIVGVRRRAAVLLAPLGWGDGILRSVPVAMRSEARIRMRYVCLTMAHSRPILNEIFLIGEQTWIVPPPMLRIVGDSSLQL